MTRVRPITAHVLMAVLVLTAICLARIDSVDASHKAAGLHPTSSVGAVAAEHGFGPTDSPVTKQRPADGAVTGPVDKYVQYPPSSLFPEGGTTNGSPSTTAATDIACSHFTFAIAPQSPKTTLPGRNFSFMLEVSNQTSSDFRDLWVNYEWEPEHATLIAGPSILSPGYGTQNLETVNSGHYRHALVTWKTTQHTTIGQTITLTVTIRSQQERDSGPSIHCELESEIVVQPPELAFLRRAAISDLEVSDRTPTPGNMIVVAASFHNHSSGALRRIDLHFNQDARNNVEWLDVRQGTSRWLFSDTSGYRGTFSERLAPSDDVALGTVISFFGPLPPGETLTLAFDAVVRDGITEGVQVEPEFCVTTVVGVSNEPEVHCSSVLVTLSEAEASMEMNMWVDSLRAHAEGPYIINVVLDHTNAEPTLGSRLHVTLPAVMRYGYNSGSLQVLSGDGGWCRLGSGAAFVPDGWLNEGLLLHELHEGLLIPSTRAGFQSHYRFTAFPVAKWHGGQLVSITALVREADGGSTVKQVQLSVPRIPLRVTVSGTSVLQRGALEVIAGGNRVVESLGGVGYQECSSTKLSFRAAVRAFDINDFPLASGGPGVYVGECDWDGSESRAHWPEEIRVDGRRSGALGAVGDVLTYCIFCDE